MRPFIVLFSVLLGLLLLSAWPSSAAAGSGCTPSEPDSEGPFYKPDAPLRSSVGKGYFLAGTVRSAGDCGAIPKARSEVWQANPGGVYDDQHRATLVSDDSGAYRFESSRPPHYGFRPPHIHMRITAEGFKTLVTQHYPGDGSTKARFDLVLVPED